MLSPGKIYYTFSAQQNWEGTHMCRICKGVCLILSLMAALGYTWRLGIPGIRGQAGPCTIIICAPGGCAPAEYECHLAGTGIQKSLRLRYDPQQPDSVMGLFPHLPPGRYSIAGLGPDPAVVEVTFRRPAAIVRPSGLRSAIAPKREPVLPVLLYFCM